MVTGVGCQSAHSVPYLRQFCRLVYQLWPLSKERSIVFQPFWLTETGAKPGSAPRHFCVAEAQISTFQSSMSKGMPPKEDTASTRKIASLAATIAPISFTGLSTVVDVSPCTTDTALASGLASKAFLIACGSSGLPHSPGTSTIFNPAFLATSISRPPKNPLLPMMIFSPLIRLLLMDASIAQVPEPTIK